MRNITNQLPIKKDVKAKVIVEGLFVFCINDEKRQAEFGVYEFAEDHEFSINISKMTYDEEPRRIGETIHLKAGLAVADDYLRNISISVKNGKPDLSVYQNDLLGTGFFEIDPNERTIEDDPGKVSDENVRDGDLQQIAQNGQDFRWIIDLEGPRFPRVLDQKLKITPGTLERKIVVNNGVVSTHSTGTRFVKRAFPKAAVQPIEKEKERCYVGYQLAIDLVASSPDDTILISFSDHNSNFANEICLTPSKDYYYEITLDNNCHLPNTPTKYFSDFQHYYNVFADVTPGERYDFEKLAGSGSNKTPCDLIFLGQHQSLSGDAIQAAK